MTQIWESRGVVVPAPLAVPWAASHAALPVVLPRGDDLAFYCSARDELGRSHIASGLLASSLTEATFDDGPVVTVGELGAFDDRGVTSSCVVQHAGLTLHYYTGWSLGVTVPFYLAIGCASSEDGGRTFSKVSPAPVLGRTAADPLLTASPWVLVDGGTWRMWYVSATNWRPGKERAEHRYNIRYAESSDGLHWRSTGLVCIDYRDEREFAIARPCVIRDEDVYRMWYCMRGATYRIGYAESADGFSWTRHDEEFQIIGGSDGWDSEMRAYPFVFDHAGTRHMLYNGNGYGATGIGHAVLATPEDAGP